MASGLERLMVNNYKNAIIQDSNVAQISAVLYYQANVLAKLEKSKKFKNTFKKTIFTQIDKDFGEYIDAQGKSKPRSFHHVYEWKKSGNKNARLFKLTSLEGEGISFKVNYEFMPSKSFVPATEGNRRHVFIAKASIMEAGMPLKIAPRSAERLVFKTDTGVVFMPKGASVTVQRPGGPGVKNQFKLHYSRWFSGDLVNQSIKKSGFQKIFSAETTKALRIPSPIKKIQYAFSAGAIRNMADASLDKSFGGSIL
jgi:hypothetical protein